MIEVDQECFVFCLHQHLLQEAAAGVPLRVEHFVLAAAGLDKQAESEREIGIGRKGPDRLRPPVFLQREVILGEVADDFAFLVAHGDGKRDDFDLGGCGGSRILRQHRRGDCDKTNQREDQGRDEDFNNGAGPPWPFSQGNLNSPRFNTCGSCSTGCAAIELQLPTAL